MKNLCLILILISSRFLTIYGLYHELLAPPNYVAADPPAVMHGDSPPPPPPFPSAKNPIADHENNDQREELHEEKHEQHEEPEEVEQETGTVAPQTTEELVKSYFEKLNI